MKSLPATLGIPSQLDVLSSVLGGEERLVAIAKFRPLISGLAYNLGWMMTSPMPNEEYLVAVNIREACEAALVFIGSEPTWGALLSAASKSEEGVAER